MKSVTFTALKTRPLGSKVRGTTCTPRARQPPSIRSASSCASSNASGWNPAIPLGRIQSCAVWSNTRWPVRSSIRSCTAPWCMSRATTNGCRSRRRRTSCHCVVRWTGSVSICRHTSAYASGSTRPMGVVPKNGFRNVSSSTCSKRRGTGYRGIEPQFGAAEQRRHLGPPAVDDLAGASMTWPLRSALTAKWLKPLLPPLLGRPKISQSVSRPLPARPMQPDPIPPYGKEISVSRSPR